MKWIAPLLILIAAMAAWPAAADPAEAIRIVATEKGAQPCLSDAELRDEIAAKKAIPQADALRAAKAAVAAEPVRARLCRREGVLVYVITALAKDGKVTRITLEAETGRVLGQR